MIYNETGVWLREVEAMATQEKLLTAEELWQQYAGQRVELTRGAPVEMTPTSDLHGKIANLIAYYMTGHALEHDLGEVRSAETGFFLRRDPDTVRAADAAFIAKARLAQIEDSSRFTPFPPDLAVEVISPTDRAGDVQTKVRDYLEAGVQLMWVIYPELRTVVVYWPDGRAETLSVEGTLNGGDVLPGFSLPLSRLFPDD